MTLDPHICYEAVLARDARYDGKFFTCARTTRIYCRPICPARPPRFANCFFVATAAAAHEAGYRPCIRCRPESSPDVAAWTGTSAVVSRALRLIENGALDAGGVTDLAGRVGLGARHLRRLFVQHLGASPIAVAQTRRILLAKQLIHETSLPMTEVALASGFGSVRRFNETFQTLFRRPPAALRKSAATELSMSTGISLLMSYRPPYDWDAMLELLGRRMIAGAEAIHEHSYCRAFVVNDASGWIRVRNVPAKRALSVDVHLADLSQLPDILSRVRRLFDLRSDPLAIDAALMRNDDLAPRVRRRPGVRIPGAWDDCELFLWTLLECSFGQARAAELMARLTDTCGTRTADPAPGNVKHAFPELPRSEWMVANLADDISMQEKHLIAQAMAIVRHEESIFQSRSALAAILVRLLPGEEAAWGEEYLAMRVLRDVEACPLEHKPMAKGRFRPRQRVIALDESFDACRPWLAYAAAHLWIDGTSCNANQPT